MEIGGLNSIVFLRIERRQLHDDGFADRLGITTILRTALRVHICDRRSTGLARIARHARDEIGTITDHPAENDDGNRNQKAKMQDDAGDRIPGKQIIRAGLEDHFCGKLMGLPMGCDV